MTRPLPPFRALPLAILATALMLALAAAPLHTQQTSAPVVLDHVVAVVNNQAILASDIDDEIRLAILDPGTGTLTPPQALDQIISQFLIQQQITREQSKADTPTTQELQARMAEIRSALPVCVRANCSSDDGWKSFLHSHGLTLERVTGYLAYRMRILAFIEERFRAGIRISDEELESYYRDLLLPQYLPSDKPPTLEAVAPRIQEILLQQQVNLLFDGWLSNLRKEGDIEVMDPAYETASQLNPTPEDAP